MQSAPTLPIASEPSPPTLPPLAAVPIEGQPTEESSRAWAKLDYLLLGLVVGFATIAIVTGIRQSSLRRTRAEVIRDLRTITTDIQSYLRVHDASPPATDAGIVPSGLPGPPKGFDWTAPTPVGGLYRLVAPPKGTGNSGLPFATVAITGFPPGPPVRVSLSELRKIDRAIDDGNLATGNFRTGFNGWPTLRVYPAP